jgi:hypothetical protein
MAAGGVTKNRKHGQPAILGDEIGDYPLQTAACFSATLSAQISMSFTGTVKNGVVILPPGLKLPDGLQVQFNVPDSAVPSSFADRYAGYIGVADDLPPDLAENLDHYVHGQRKS